MFNFGCIWEEIRKHKSFMTDVDKKELNQWLLSDPGLPLPESPVSTDK